MQGAAQDSFDSASLSANVHDDLYTEVYVTRSHFSLFSLDTGHKHSACYLQSEGAKEMRLRVACVIRRCPFVIDGLGAWRYV